MWQITGCEPDYKLTPRYFEFSHTYMYMYSIRSSMAKYNYTKMRFVTADHSATIAEVPKKVSYRKQAGSCTTRRLRWKSNTQATIHRVERSLRSLHLLKDNKAMYDFAQARTGDHQ